MARIRSIHPGQWSDEHFVAMSETAQLFTLGIRNWCDDNGIFEWKPMKLKMLVFPAALYNAEKINQLLAEMVEAKQVKKIEIDGREYGWVRNFHDYQSPNKPSFTYPVPSECGSGYELHPKFDGNGSKRVTKQARSAIAGEGEGEGVGEVINNTQKLPSVAPFYLGKSGRPLTGDVLDGFIRFWKAFDLMEDKAEAADAWLDIPGRTKTVEEDIIFAATKEAENRPSIIKKGLNPKRAPGWLTGRRWEKWIEEKEGSHIDPKKKRMIESAAVKFGVERLPGEPFNSFKARVVLAYNEAQSINKGKKHLEELLEKRDKETTHLPGG